MTGDAVWEDEGGEAPGRWTQLPRLLPDVGRTGLQSPERTPAQCPGRSQPLYDASAKGTPSYNDVLYEANLLESNIYDNIALASHPCYTILFAVINVSIKTSLAGIEFGWVV